MYIILVGFKIKFFVHNTFLYLIRLETTAANIPKSIARESEKFSSHVTLYFFARVSKRAIKRPETSNVIKGVELAFTKVVAIYETTKVAHRPIIMPVIAKFAKPPLELLFFPEESFSFFEYPFKVKIVSRHPQIIPTVITNRIVTRLFIVKTEESRAVPMFSAAMLATVASY